MRISPTGLAQTARPHLGRVKRGLQRRRDDWSPSGPAASWMPRPAEAREATRTYLAATTALGAGRHETALRLLARSLELDPRYGRRWTRYGDALKSCDRIDEAIEAFRRAHEAAPGAQRPLFEIATLRLGLVVDAGDLAAVARTIEAELHDGRPLDAQADFLVGLALESGEEPAAARRAFRRSLDAETDRPERWLSYARFEAAQGEWAASAEAYRTAIDLDDEMPAGETPVDPDLLAERLGSETAPAGAGGWAATAAAARALLGDDPDNPEAVRALALALHSLAQWTDAVPALRRAIEASPTDLALLDRLTTAASRTGDDELAVDCAQRALVMAPTARRFQAVAVQLENAGRHEEAVVAFDHSVRLGIPDPAWFERFGAAQRRSGEWAAAATLYRWALERHPEDAQLWYLLGFTLEKAEEPAGAEAAYRRALDLRPDDANWWFRLGYLHEQYGPERTVVRPRTGLEQTATGDLERAATHYRTALRLAPDRVATLKRLAGVEESMGLLDSARAHLERAVELEPDESMNWHLLGRVIAAEANRRGMYHSDEHDQLEHVWGRAIELQPHRTGSRDQLARASIKAARWKVADEVAWYPVPRSAASPAERTLRDYLRSDGTERIDEVRQVLAQPTDELMWVPREWWFSLHWRLLTDNYFTLAYRAKSLMAERTLVDGTGHPVDNLAGYLEAARAMTFLGRNDLALDALTPSLTSSLPDRTRRTLARQRADVELLLGRPGAHVGMVPTDLDPVVMEAERAFEAMISGRRIAIVGPGVSDLGNGAEIDDHDVVIRTKFVRDQLADHVTMAGARTDVSYYALGSARHLRDDIADAISAGALRMAVFRTATYTAEPPHIVRPADTRYVPSEYTAGFRSSQFAIQRIFYDVLRYGPASIKVFNIDFFLSRDSYRPGYLADYADRATEQGFLKVLGAFGHDFLADFVFTQEVRRHGLLEVDENVDKILALEPADYLRALDRRD